MNTGAALNKTRSTDIDMDSVAPIANASARSLTKAPSTRRRGVQSFHVYLSPRIFCLCWWLVLASHAFVGSFAISVTALHRYLQEDFVAPSVASLNVPVQALRMTARSFFLVGLGHLIAILRMIYNSIKARQFTLHKIHVEAQSKSGPLRHSLDESTRTLSKQAALVVDEVSSSWDRYFGVNGHFGLNGKHFELAFMIREALEIAMQSYQANRLSQSVPRVWINQIAVGAIALNCVSSPLVHFLLHDREGLRRLINVLLDALLDVCGSVIIPFIVILPYVQVYDTSHHLFPDSLIMNDVWFVNAVSENRQVLVTSMVDFIATVLPQLGILGSLMTVKNVLRRRSLRVQATPSSTETESAPPKSALSSKLFSARGVLQQSASSHIHVRRTLRRNAQRSSVSQRCRRITVHAFFVALGMAILSLHLSAMNQISHHVDGCQLYLAAWSSSGLACSVMFLSCYAYGFEGSAHDISSVLAELDPLMLQVLVLSHCPALEIPSRLTAFSNLIGLEIFNSTLVEWPNAAGLRDATQRSIGYVYMIKTNMTEFPQGLLHEELPRELTHILVVQSNLPLLPDSLGRLWASRDWILLAFEELPLLQRLPESICKLSSLQWSFVGSGIQLAPENCFAGAMYLALSGCPLERLPSTVAFDSAGLQMLFVEHTKISSLPTWLTEGTSSESLRYSALFGSPLCDDSILTETKDFDRWNASCTTGMYTATSGYPWSMMLPQRELVP